MLFASIPGLVDIKGKLVQAIKDNHLAHALLLYGPEGSANLCIALALATYINCENPGVEDSCGKCSSCIKMAKLVHPDVNFTFPLPSNLGKDEDKEDGDKNHNILIPWRVFATQTPYSNLQDWISHNGFSKQLNISKGAAKTIIKTLSLKSFEGGYKIILIWSPELLHPYSANALLKVLEEPPEKTLFLLVAHQPDHLLNTILSRTQKLMVRGFTDMEIIEHLVSKGMATKEVAQQIAPLADGNMREVYRLLDQVQDENTSRFRDWMRICYNLDLNAIMGFADSLSSQDKEAQKALLLSGLNILRESLLKKSQLDSLMRTAPSDRKFIEDFGKNVLTQDKIVKLYEMLNEAPYFLERNANARILFANLSFNVARVLRKKAEA